MVSGRRTIQFFAQRLIQQSGRYKTSGELAYHFLLDIDFARLDSLKFESELKEKDFRIIEYGATSLSKMSEEFVYTAYENGIPGQNISCRTFMGTFYSFGQHFSIAAEVCHAK